MAMKIGNALPDRFNISRFYQGLFNNGKFGKAGSLLKPQNITKLQASTLSTTDRTTANVSAKTYYNINRKAEAERIATQRGNTLEVRTRSSIQDNITAQRQAELNQKSWQLTQGKVNGKTVYSNTEKDLRQVSDEKRSTAATVNRNGVELITKETKKTGNVTRNSTHIESSGEGNQTAETLVNRKTDTQTQLKTYDQTGQLKSSIFNRQVVTQDQKTAMARTMQSEGNRDIEQMTVVTDERNGNVAVRNVNTKTFDNAQGSQTITTNTATEIATLIEKLDADGNLLSARNYSQQTDTNDLRSIETNRMIASEQNTHVKSRAGEVDTVTKGHQDINATTIDTTNTAGTVKNFDGQGNLISEQAFERNVTSMTTEDREIDNQIRTNVATQNGATVAVTELKARDDQEIETRIVSEQNGQVTQRTIETANRVKTTGEMENQVNAAGVRTLEFATEQTRQSESRDLTVGPTGQGRLVETNAWASQEIQGNLQFNPDTAQVTAAGTKPAAGAIVIDFGTSTGLRSSFKMDNGVLKFDFTASRMSLSEQGITTGQVATKPNGNMTITGNETVQAKGVAEEIHFSGQVVSSVDSEGNRVITLEGNVTDEGIGALFVNNFEGMQGEIGKAEMDINGKLTVNRQTTVNGNETTTRTQAEAEMEINRVENREDMGINVRSLTPLNTTSGFSAGLVADHGALRFNFGVFNMGISFVA